MIIRWVSEDGKRKWIYPVEKDIYTKGKIIKQVSRKAKVIGITKVNIPSPMHPIIPYNVILLEDEHGNRIPKKTMKDYKIGDVYEINPATTNDAVIITKIKYDIYEYLKESLELLYDYNISSEDKILIKPSIIEPAYAYQTVTTNSELLNALIIYIKEKGAKDIVVAEQAMLGNDTMASAKKAGVLDVCEKHDIPFIDLRNSEYTEKTSDGFTFKIAKEILERKVINVPVMKTNSQIGISGAMENMLRVVDEYTQKKMFKEDIDKTLPKLIRILPKFLTIGDATIGMQGNGPTLLGEPAFLNMLFLSKDPVALDAVFSEAGILTTPRYIKVASLLDVGNSDTKKIEIIGDELEAIKCPLKAAEKDVTAHTKIKLIDGKADPYTYNTALKMAAKLVGLLGEDVNLVIGSLITKDMLKGRTRLVVYGKDAIEQMNALGIKSIAEIPEDVDGIEKVMLLKSVLQNPNKENLTSVDKLKSKIAGFGMKIKKKF
ncbi:MAG: DUF362 domain-containing protein [Nanoarchaeota archaeon]|nr:DUF362 domain-containing protein [Nanoarchaeota archaeon]